MKLFIYTHLLYALHRDIDSSMQQFASFINKLEELLISNYIGKQQLVDIDAQSCRDTHRANQPTHKSTGQP